MQDLPTMVRELIQTPVHITDHYIQEQEDGNKPCKCAIHDAVLEKLGFDDPTDVYVHPNEVVINHDGDVLEYTCSRDVHNWQMDNADRYDDSEPEEWESHVKPITIVFDHDRLTVSILQ